MRCLEEGKVLTWWYSNACDNTALISGTDAIPKPSCLSENPRQNKWRKGSEEFRILTRGSGSVRLYEMLRGTALSGVTLISILEPVGTYQCVYEMNMVI